MPALIPHVGVETVLFVLSSPLLFVLLLAFKFAMLLLRWFVVPSLLLVADVPVSDANEGKSC